MINRRTPAAILSTATVALSACVSLPDLLAKPPARVDHVRGVVTAVGQRDYTIRDDLGKSIRVELARGGHLYRLVPSSSGAIHSGWSAHAIGGAEGNSIRTQMLVLFPPAAAAGVPPPAAGMEGIGRITGSRRAPVLRTNEGARRLALLPGARIVVAIAVPLRSLKRGDMAMAFGRRTSRGFRASIVHIPPRMSTMEGNNRTRGTMAGGMGREKKGM
ncbi:MAG: hypothetical protein LC772_11185 [Chloroflexi bacterium]|nr:hypothetical protein [Chloroflexota bacterium]